MNANDFSTALQNSDILLWLDNFKNNDLQAQILISPVSIDHYNQVNDEILPELRQLLRVDTSQKNQDRMIELLQTLSDLCILVLKSGAVEPNKQNQHMLDNFGMCLCVIIM